MKLYLYRTRTRELTTDGVLKGADGKRICDTAELTPERLPRGEYQVVFRRHPKHGCRAPCIDGGAFIIHGNGVFTKGFGAGIVVGEHLVPGVVIRSRPYFDRIVKRIEKVFRRGGEVVLVVR